MEHVTPLSRGRWTRGIGNDSRSVYDGESHLVATTIRAEDGTAIVNAVNDGPRLRDLLRQREEEIERLTNENARYLLRAQP